MNKGGFTLLELMITIAIVFVVSLTVYAPYSYYQQKTHLRLAAKQIEQFLLSTRSSSVYGTSSGSNLSFGLYLNSGENTQVELFSYPFTKQSGFITGELGTEIESKKLTLEPGIYIDSIGGYENMLIFFEAISGANKLYYWDETNTMEEYSGETLDIEISYKGTDAANLKKTLRYYRQTNIVDY